MNQQTNVVQFNETRTKNSKSSVLDHAANELIFAVVGHVGSGTSAIAQILEALLKETPADGLAFDVEIIKATSVIDSWAKANGKDPLSSHQKTLEVVEKYQNFGDEIRSSGDFAAISKGFALKIREIRASKLAKDASNSEAIIPDGKPRAYILDSIRHPAEVELLRHIYQDAFILVGVVCEETKRLNRVTEKYPDAGKERALSFMQRDAKALEKYGQRVSDAFHLSDFFVDNTASRHNDDLSPNPEWDVSEKLSRLIKIIRHNGIVRPELSETAMLYASGASMRSACLSRQVGAALVDKSGNMISTGCNEVPKAGGGVYGENFFNEGDADHRCAYRTLKDHDKPFCSNTKVQNEIIDELINSISKIKEIDESERLQFNSLFKSGRVGSLIEFSRAVHAEMDAIITAARKGISTIGTRLFVTTFPCHYCARHIISAGIDEVQYIEPYPKSQALELHSDSIEVTASKWKTPSSPSKESPEIPKVLFRPFTGVAPRLYKRAFGKDRDLKNSTSGILEVSSPEWGTPWHLRRMSYAQLEAELASEIG